MTDLRSMTAGGQSGGGAGRVLRWHRVMAAAAPRMAAAKAARPQPDAAHGAVRAHCIEGVLRAGGAEPAAQSMRSEQRGESRRNGAAIDSQQQDQGVLSRVQACFGSEPHLFSR